MPRFINKHLIREQKFKRPENHEIRLKLAVERRGLQFISSKTNDAGIQLIIAADEIGGQQELLVPKELLSNLINIKSNQNNVSIRRRDAILQVALSYESSISESSSTRRGLNVARRNPHNVRRASRAAGRMQYTSGRTNTPKNTMDNRLFDSIIKYLLEINREKFKKEKSIPMSNGNNTGLEKIIKDVINDYDENTLSGRFNDIDNRFNDIDNSLDEIKNDNVTFQKELREILESIVSTNNGSSKSNDPNP